MADVKQDLPGTWLVRVTQSGALISRAIVTYTSDGGFFEGFVPRIEGMVGIWEATDDENDDENDHKRDHYRFMGYRYRHKLAVAPPSQDVVATYTHTARVRGTCHLTGNDSFHCTLTDDDLDANENVIPTSAPGHYELDGVRMKVVPE